MSNRVTSVKIFWGGISVVVFMSLYNKMMYAGKKEEWEQYKKDHDIDMDRIRQTYRELAENEELRKKAQGH